MNAKTVRLNSILTSVMLFLYAACGVLNPLLTLLFNNSTFNLPTGIFLCLAVMLPTVVLLIFGIKQAKQKQGKADLIFSIMTLTVSIVWIIAAVLNWVIVLARNLIIEFYYRLDIAMSLGDLLTLLSYVSGVYMLFTTVVALYLLAVYVISVLRAKQKMLQLKAELHKPAVALLILVPNFITLLETIINPLLGRVSTELYVIVSYIFLYVSFGITILLTVAFAVFVLVFGLIVKKQPNAAQEAQPETATEAQQPSDIPFNVPTGVNPNDI